MSELPELISYVGRLMFERRLTDIAGGNISAREGDRIYITPRYAGKLQHWQLDPQDILCGEIDDEAFEANPRFSREGKAHLAIYRSIPSAQAVIHAHSFHIQPFAVAGKPIEPVLEATQKLGTIELVPYAPTHSAELAVNIAGGLASQEEQIRTFAAAIMVPTHGIVVASKDLLTALDALERIDWNAWCILAGRMLAN